MDQFSQLFTARQLTAMVTLSDLVKGIAVDVRRDAQAAGLAADIFGTARRSRSLPSRVG
jgi:adenine-specific DNA methylase